MRHRSESNSRPAENRQLRRQYMLDNIWCECNVFNKRRFPETDSHDPHHIFGGRGGRLDVISNLLAVSRDAHEWLEENKTAGRIVAIAAKIKKGEFDPAEMRRASGMHVNGWLAKAEVSIDWVVPILDELRKLFP